MFDSTVADQFAFAVGAAEDQAGLDDAGEDQDGARPAGDRLGRRVGRVERIQGGLGVVVEVGLGRRFGHLRQHGRRDRRGGQGQGEGEAVGVQAGFQHGGILSKEMCADADHGNLTAPPSPSHAKRSIDKSGNNKRVNTALRVAETK